MIFRLIKNSRFLCKNSNACEVQNISCQFQTAKYKQCHHHFHLNLCQKEIPQFQIFEEDPFEHLDHLFWRRGEGPIIILTASLLSRPCLPVYRPVYSRVSPCITVYCPHRVSRCIGTENLRSHTEPVSSASSTALAFSWFGIGIVLRPCIRPSSYQNIAAFGIS